MKKTLTTIAFTFSVMISSLALANDSFDNQTFTREDILQAVEAMDHEDIEALTELDLSKEDLLEKVANVSEEKLEEITLMVLQNREMALSWIASDTIIITTLIASGAAVLIALIVAIA